MKEIKVDENKITPLRVNDKTTKSLKGMTFISSVQPHWLLPR